VDVADSLVAAESLDSLAAGLPIAPVIAARVAQLRRTVARLDRENAPIPLTRTKPLAPDLMPLAPVTGLLVPDTLGAVHFGEPKVLELLRWTPYVSLAGTLLLLTLGLWGLAVIRQGEKRTIWVGM